MNSAPFAAVAYAGHTVTGDWCACGSVACICDPGETRDHITKPESDQTEERLDQVASPREHSRSGFDFGTGALMLALALFVWTRLRA